MQSRDDEPSAGGTVELPHELGDERMFRVSHPLRVDLENGLPVDLDLLSPLHPSSAQNRDLLSLVSPKKRKKYRMLTLCPLACLLHRTPAIREYDAKQLLSYWLPRSPVPIPCKAESSVAPVKVAQVQW